MITRSDTDVQQLLKDSMHFSSTDLQISAKLAAMNKKLANNDPFINYVIHAENAKLKKASKVDPYASQDMRGRRGLNDTQMSESEIALDFRGLGKSSRSIYEHSKYSCILPYTTQKQKALKLAYLKWTQEQVYNSFHTNQNETQTLSSRRYDSTRSQEKQTIIYEEFSKLLRQINNKQSIVNNVVAAQQYRSKSIGQAYMNRRAQVAKTSQQSRLGQSNLNFDGSFHQGMPSINNYNSQNKIDINRTFDHSTMMSLNDSGMIDDDHRRGAQLKNPLINQSYSIVKTGKNRIKLQPIEKPSALRRKVELFQKNAQKQQEMNNDNPSAIYYSPVKGSSLAMPLSQKKQNYFQSADKRLNTFSDIEKFSNKSTIHPYEENLATQNSENILDIPEEQKNKVPRHWLTFVEDAYKELSDFQSDKYEGGVSKGIKHGQGYFVYPNGDVFKGMFRGDLRHGSGICKFKNGIIYRGEWREDQMNGHGMVFSPPGEMIEINFQNGKIQDGRIKILYSNGEFYEGDFRSNKRNGKGVHYYINGDCYEGEFMNDKRVGKGKLQFSDGGSIISQFIDDQADGHGIYEDKFGNGFQSMVADDRETQGIVGAETGAIRNGKLFEMGKIKYKNDDKYKGIFKDGRPSKFGEMRYQMSIEGIGGELEGADYKGEFKGGKRHGKGIMKWDDGTQFDGFWSADDRISGTLKMPNGSVYLGTFKNDRMDGLAKLILSSGLIFEGEFKEGFCPSLGKLYYQSGNIYFGQHKDFLKDGYGKMAYYNGDVYEGQWENDKRSGKGRHLEDKIGLYIGEYGEDKKNGKGRFYDEVKDEIYEGEYSNDKKNGEGTIIRRNGEVISGDFRNDFFEGKQKFEKNLTKQEIEKYFQMALKNTEQYISVVGGGKKQLF